MKNRFTIAAAALFTLSIPMFGQMTTGEWSTSITDDSSMLEATVVPPLGNYLINEFGWRAAFVWLGAGWGSVAFVLCFFFLFGCREKEFAKALKDIFLEVPVQNLE